MKKFKLYLLAVMALFALGQPAAKATDMWLYQSTDASNGTWTKMAESAEGGVYRLTDLTFAKYFDAIWYSDANNGFVISDTDQDGSAVNPRNDSNNYYVATTTQSDYIGSSLTSNVAGVDAQYDVVKNGMAYRMYYVEAGTYDIYFDSNNSKVYIVTAGTDMSSLGNFSATVNMYIYQSTDGSNGNWSKMEESTEGGVYRITNQTYATYLFWGYDSNNGFVISDDVNTGNPRTDAVNSYYAATSNQSDWVGYSLTHNVSGVAVQKQTGSISNRMFYVEAGTYDIYIKPADSKVYIVNAGTDMPSLGTFTPALPDPKLFLFSSTNSWGEPTEFVYDAVSETFSLTGIEFPAGSQIALSQTGEGTAWDALDAATTTFVTSDAAGFVSGTNTIEEATKTTRPIAKGTWNITVDLNNNEVTLTNFYPANLYVWQYNYGYSDASVMAPDPEIDGTYIIRNYPVNPVTYGGVQDFSRVRIGDAENAGDATMFIALDGVSFAEATALPIILDTPANTVINQAGLGLYDITVDLKNRTIEFQRARVYLYTSQDNWEAGQEIVYNAETNTYTISAVRLTGTTAEIAFTTEGGATVAYGDLPATTNCYTTATAAFAAGSNDVTKQSLVKSTIPARLWDFEVDLANMTITATLTYPDKMYIYQTNEYLSEPTAFTSVSGQDGKYILKNYVINASQDYFGNPETFSNVIICDNDVYDNALKYVGLTDGQTYTECVPMSMSLVTNTSSFHAGIGTYTIIVDFNEGTILFQPMMYIYTKGDGDTWTRHDMPATENGKYFIENVILKDTKVEGVDRVVLKVTNSGAGHDKGTIYYKLDAEASFETDTPQTVVPSASSSTTMGSTVVIPESVYDITLNTTTEQILFEVTYPDNLYVYQNVGGNWNNSCVKMTQDPEHKNIYTVTHLAVNNMFDASKPELKITDVASDATDPLNPTLAGWQCGTFFIALDTNTVTEFKEDVDLAIDYDNNSSFTMGSHITMYTGLYDITLDLSARTIKFEVNWPQHLYIYSSNDGYATSHEMKQVSDGFFQLEDFVVATNGALKITDVPDTAQDLVDENIKGYQCGTIFFSLSDWFDATKVLNMNLSNFNTSTLGSGGDPITAGTYDIRIDLDTNHIRFYTSNPHIYDTDWSLATYTNSEGKKRELVVYQSVDSKTLFQNATVTLRIPEIDNLPGVDTPELWLFKNDERIVGRNFNWDEGTTTITAFLTDSKFTDNKLKFRVRIPYTDNVLESDWYEYTLNVNSPTHDADMLSAAPTVNEATAEITFPDLDDKYTGVTYHYHVIKTMSGAKGAVLAPMLTDDPVDYVAGSSTTKNFQLLGVNAGQPTVVTAWTEGTLGGNLVKSTPYQIEFTATTTSIETLTADDNAAETWYTLQGVRVENPAAGQVYIRVRGNQAVKVAL